MENVFIFLLIVGVSFYAGFRFCKTNYADYFFTKEEIESFRDEYEQKIAKIKSQLNESRAELRNEINCAKELKNEIEVLKKKIIAVEREDVNLTLKALSNFV